MVGPVVDYWNNFATSWLYDFGQGPNEHHLHSYALTEGAGVTEVNSTSSERFRGRPRFRGSAGACAAAMGLLIALVFGASPDAMAQDVDEILAELEDRGYYIESGADGSDRDFADLVRRTDGAADNWYFVSMADVVDPAFADTLFGEVRPGGNVLVYYIDGDFVEVQLASGETESIEARALAPFEDDWDRPEDFMEDVVARFDELTGGSSSTSGGSSSSTAGGNTSSGNSASSDSGGGFPWLLVGIPVVLIGGIWFVSRRGKSKKADSDLETAQKIRAELQTEIDELANDVLVLSGPIDLSDKEQAITFYREATDAYLDISDEIPDVEKLEAADLRELSALGTRVAHARWQMDAAEALLDGEPIPEKPKVAPPPAPPAPPEVQQRRTRQRQRMPQRQARPRVPYSRSRRRSGGGLLDILIAGAGMMGGRSGGGMFGGTSRGRSAGGMFGSGSRGRTTGRTRSGGSSRNQRQPRPGGGVFGRSSGSRSSSRSSRSSSSRRSRGTTSRRSTSRRRRRPRNAR